MRRQRLLPLGPRLRGDDGRVESSEGAVEDGKERGEEQGEESEGHWERGSGCEVYSISVHWLGTGGKLG